MLVHAAESKEVLLPVDYDPALISLRLDYTGGSVLQAPVEEGQKVGVVTAYYDNIPLTSADLVTLNSVGGHQVAQVDAVTEEGDSGIWSDLMHYWYLTIPFALVLLLVIILLIIRAVNVRRAKKRAKRRRRNATRRRTYD